MSFAFLDDAEGVVAGEVDEPFAWDDLEVMGFGDAKPAAADPSSDGFSIVAEDGFPVLWRDDVGQVVSAQRIPQRFEKPRENRGDNHLFIVSILLKTL